jgi:hypothetical protein
VGIALENIYANCVDKFIVKNVYSDYSFSINVLVFLSYKLISK